MSGGGPRVLFIRSLGHSGSTVLELAMSSLEGTLALGEVGNLVERFGVRAVRAPCSCGAPVRDCPVWGPVAVAVEDDPGLANGDRYRLAYQRAADHAGPGVTLVDNAKTGAWLDAAIATGADVTVVSLTRDMRSWALARHARAERSRREGDGSSGLRRRVGDSVGFGMWHWHRENLRRDAQLAELDVPTIAVSYEELCRRPAATMRQLAEAAGLADPGTTAFVDGALELRSERHVLIGNQLLRGEVPPAIRADERWRQDRSWRLPALLLRPAMAYNARVVGSDTA